MKVIKPYVLLCLFILFSCDVDFDINEGDARRKFETKVRTVKTFNGKALQFDLRVENEDGIAAIIVEIPLLDVQFTAENDPVSDTMGVKYAFDIDNQVEADSGIIYITLIDTNDNSYQKRYNFTID